VSRLIGWSAFVTKVTFCNAFRSSKGLSEFKAKKKLEKCRLCLSLKTGKKIAKCCLRARRRWPCASFQTTFVISMSKRFGPLLLNGSTQNLMRRQIVYFSADSHSCRNKLANRLDATAAVRVVLTS
jgi:hypothetical protein